MPKAVAIHGGRTHSTITTDNFVEYHPLTDKYMNLKTAIAPFVVSPVKPPVTHREPFDRLSANGMC